MLRHHLVFILFFSLGLNEIAFASGLEQYDYTEESVAEVGETVPQTIETTPETIETAPPTETIHAAPPAPTESIVLEAAPVTPMVPSAAPAFQKKFEIELGTKVLPYDALYKPLLLEASMHWEFAEDWLWEIGRFGWAVTKFSSGLREQVYRDLKAELQGVDEVDLDSLRVLEGDEMKHLRFVTGSTMAYRLFQGQVRLARKKDFQHEWLVRLGGAYLNFKDDHQAGPMIGAQVRFGFDDRFDARLNFDQVIGVMMARQRSIGMMGLSFGYRW
jgi:hypothetical protein